MCSYNSDEKQYANELKRWENMRGIGVKKGVTGIGDMFGSVLRDSKHMFKKKNLVSG